MLSNQQQQSRDDSYSLQGSLKQKASPFGNDVKPQQLSQMLCDVVMLGSDFDVADWCKIIDLYVYHLANSIGLEATDKVTKFALAMAMIGSEHPILFQHVFQLFSEWEKIKGPYWIIQTELQRHFCLHVIRAKLPLLMRKQSKTLINRLFSTIEFENIENKRLREELPRLQDELQNLLDGVLEKMSIKKREEILNAYCDNYPLSDFVKWFLIWAQPRFAMICHAAKVTATTEQVRRAIEEGKQVAKSTIATQTHISMSHSSSLTAVTGNKRSIDRGVDERSNNQDPRKTRRVSLGEDVELDMMRSEDRRFERRRSGGCQDHSQNDQVEVVSASEGDLQNEEWAVEEEEEEEEEETVAEVEVDIDRFDFIGNNHEEYCNGSSSAIVVRDASHWEKFQQVINEYLNPELL